MIQALAFKAAAKAVGGFIASKRWLLIAAAAIALVWGAWWLNDRLDRANDADAAEQAIIDRAAAEGRSHTIGMNLETGLNDYRAVAKKLDNEVSHATANDSGNRFTADSVQRAAARIAAGEAARRRAAGL